MTTTDTTTRAATAALLAVVRLAAHGVADRVVQTPGQALGKGARGRYGVYLSDGAVFDQASDDEVMLRWMFGDRIISATRRGQLCCAGHVATYTATELGSTIAAVRAFHLPVNWRGLILGQLVSTVTHFIIDRRWTLRLACSAPLLLARHLPVGSRIRTQVKALSKADYYRHGGAEPIDQALHQLCVVLGVLVAVRAGSTAGARR